jgi:ketosteroid isomerase-like protein
MALVGALTLPVWSAPIHAQNAEAEVDQVLDQLHHLASVGDFDAYFDLYTADAIFMGTDATERWTIDDFKGYARPAFADGSGWTYEPTERHIYLAPGGQAAWFDERLQNASFGETRGTGVLVLGADGRWRITQYNLAIPIPNDLARDFVAQIRAATGS